MLYDELEDGYVNTSLGQIHYKQHFGGRTKIVFLHGFASSTKSWVKLIECLPEDLNLCFIDLLGHGGSDAPYINYTVAVHARVVWEFIEAKGMQDCCIFGHSYGGWIAGLIAQGGFGEGGLVLEDAMGLKDYFDDLENDGMKDSFNNRWAEEARILGLSEHVIESSVGADKVADELTAEGLGRVARRAMVVWGGKDTVVSMKYAKLFSKYMKGSSLNIIEEAGHVPHYTNAKDVATMLMRFIGRD